MSSNCAEIAAISQPTVCNQTRPGSYTKAPPHSACKLVVRAASDHLACDEYRRTAYIYVICLTTVTLSSCS